MSVPGAAGHVPDRPHVGSSRLGDRDPVGLPEQEMAPYPANATVSPHGVAV